MPDCFIFDIDGTLANGDHRLHHIQKEPKDWDSYFKASLSDLPHKHIIDLAKRLAMTGAAIVYVSGRSDLVRTETMAWLGCYGAPHGKLYMRKQGDHRNDDLLKIELLAELRADHFNPLMAFDDRKRVVDAWRKAGVPCCQVADGDF